MKYIANPVQVEAWKIVAKSDKSAYNNYVLEDGREVWLTDGMLARYVPVVGDYFVRQSDGYEYVNPKDVFERKYSPQQTVEPRNENFNQSFDGLEWAKAFVSYVAETPSIATDVATMHTWFANAIMRGYDEHAHRHPGPVAYDRPPEEGS